MIGHDDRALGEKDKLRVRHRELVAAGDDNRKRPKAASEPRADTLNVHVQMIGVRAATVKRVRRVRYAAFASTPAIRRIKAGWEKSARASSPATLPWRITRMRRLRFMTFAAGKNKCKDVEGCGSTWKMKRDA